MKQKAPCPECFSSVSDLVHRSGFGDPGLLHGDYIAANAENVLVLLHFYE